MPLGKVFTHSDTPIVLSIAGSDCSAGAGAQADLKTITAHGCYALTALTSVVSETPTRVSRIRLLDAAMVRDQIGILAEEFPIAAAKAGMLGGAEQILAVVEAWATLATRGVPLVVDPVMVATSGARLLEDDAMEALTKQLFPLASILTPNMDEAAVLLGRPVKTRAEMEQGATELSQMHGCAILLKGGHLEGDSAPDVLVADGRITWFEGKRIPDVHTHGTGCTYSAAIASGLAKGQLLEEAVRSGKAYVTGAIGYHYRWGNLDALHHGHPQLPY